MAILESGRIHPPGLPAQNLIHVEARDARDALWAMEEGLRCAALSAVIGEIWGDPRALDFTATRRLAVASERVGRGRAGWCGWAARQSERRADALADRERAVAAPTTSIRARRERRRGTPSCSARAACRRGAGASRMKRVLSIWLPQLAIERWAKTQRLARLTRRSSSPSKARMGRSSMPSPRPRPSAARRPGARLTDARALDPALMAVPADPDGDAALLQRLARWAGRWSPLVEVDGADGLRLDVTGVAHLFGGEDGLVRDVRAAVRGRLG